jgi:hypothetical protein
MGEDAITRRGPLTDRHNNSPMGGNDRSRESPIVTEWENAHAAIRSTGRWDHYQEMRMGAGANLSVRQLQDDHGRTVFRAEAAWDNWTLFKIAADYDSADTALAALPEFAVALTDLLGEKGAWKGLIQMAPADGE